MKRLIEKIKKPSFSKVDNEGNEGSSFSVKEITKSTVVYLNKRSNELSMYFFLTLLLWIKSYLVMKFYFNITIENKYQEIILLISPLSFSILIYSIAILLTSKRYRSTVIFIITAVMSLVMYGNVIFYRFYTDFVTIPVLMQTSNMGDLGSSFFGSIKWYDIFIFVDLFFVFYILFMKKKNLNSVKYRESGIGILLAGVVFLFNLSMAETERPDLLSRTFDREILVKNLGLYNYHIYDVYMQSRTSAKKAMAEEEDIKSVEKYINENTIKDYNDYSGIAKGKNVVFIALESLQSAFIQESIDGEEITPFLNKLIGDSFYFNNIYHQTAQGKSSDSEFVIDTGWYPLGRGSVYFTHANNTYKGLPLILANNDYSTNVFHANSKTFWNREQMYKRMGVSKFYDVPYYNVTAENSIGWGLKDKEFFEQTVELMKDLEEPYYSKLITLTNHYPFELEDEDIDLENYYSNSKTLNRYVSTVNYLDRSLEYLFNKLKEDDMYDDTVFVLYGDHYGISENHNKAMARYLGKGNVGSSYLSPYDVAELQKIPLIIHIPGVTDGGKGKIVNTVGGQVDFKPTILNLLGITVNDLEFGRDLLGNNHDETIAFRNGTVVSKKLVYAEKLCYVRPEFASEYFSDKEIDEMEAKEPDYNYSLMYDSYLKSRLLDKLKTLDVDAEVINKVDSEISTLNSKIKEYEYNLSEEKFNKDIPVKLDYDYTYLTGVYNQYILNKEKVVDDTATVETSEGVEKESNESTEDSTTTKTDEVTVADKAENNNTSKLLNYDDYKLLNQERFNSGYKIDVNNCKNLKTFSEKELSVSDELIYGDLLRFYNYLEDIDMNNIESEDLIESMMRDIKVDELNESESKSNSK